MGILQGETIECRVGGKSIPCPICGNDKFYQDKRKLNSTMASFFGFDWANKNALIFTCSKCTHILWFNSDL